MQALWEALHGGKVIQDLTPLSRLFTRLPCVSWPARLLNGRWMRYYDAFSHLRGRALAEHLGIYWRSRNRKPSKPSWFGKGISRRGGSSLMASRAL